MPGVVEGMPMSAEMALLAAAIDRFCERRVDGPSAEDMGGELTHLRHQCDRLELEFAQAGKAFAATDEYDRQGYLSPIHWIRFNCHMGSGAVADRLAVGEHMDGLAGDPAAAGFVSTARARPWRPNSRVTADAAARQITSIRWMD